MDKEKFARQIVENIGGYKNIQSIDHCATRLRIYLRDDSQFNMKAIQNLNGVFGAQKVNRQYQIVVGQIVPELCDIIKNSMGLSAEASPSTKKEHRNFSIKSAFGSFMELIAGCFAPIIPALSAAGFIKVLLIILPMLGWMNATGQTYYILNLASDAVFYFMPIVLAYTSAKKFNANIILSLIIASMILHPNWTALVAKGGAVHFFGLPVTLSNYNGSVVPIILSVWILSKLDPIVEKIVPKLVSSLLKPFVLLLIMTPIVFVVTGPIGYIVGEGLARLITLASSQANWLIVSLLCLFSPFIAMTGMHLALIPLALSSIHDNGFDTIILVWFLCNTIAQGAMALGVLLKTKNPKLRELAIPAAISGLFGGVSEPAMYGIGFKMKKPLYAAMIGAAISGLFAGIMKLKAYAFGSYTLLALPSFAAHGNMSNLWIAVIASAIAIIVTVSFVWILGFDDSVYQTENSGESEPLPEKKASDLLTGTENIDLPIKGKVIDADEINDQVFSSSSLGTTLGIIPVDNVIYSPCDGIVSAAFPTKHALGIKSDQGVELLIHVGIDSVELNGEGFESFVQQGEHVKRGQKLLNFDPEILKKHQIDSTVIVVILNAHQSYTVEQKYKKGKIYSSGDTLLTVHP
ncbi:MAG: beta-glucoside-specific PTS transporter subunit IIABC [Sporolactobacillus sp.]